MLSGFVVTFLIGLLLIGDTNRFKKHIALAEQLMAKGMSEEKAMEVSGCNHWEQSLIRRIWKKYPPIIVIHN